MFLPKLLIITFVFAHVAYSKRVTNDALTIWSNLIAPINNECVQKTHPKHEDMVTMYTGGYVPDTEEMGCYLNCLYRKLNIVTADGAIDFLHMMDIAPYMTFDVSQRCARAAAYETNFCKKSFILGDCIIKAMSTV